MRVGRSSRDGEVEGMKSLRDDLKKGSIHHVYLLCGDDAERRNEALALLESTLSGEARDLTVEERKSAVDTSPGDLVDLLLTPPLFGGWRVVTVREVEAWKELGPLAPFLERASGFSTLLLTSGAPAKEIKIASSVRRWGKVYEFKQPQGGERVARLKEMARAAGVQLDQSSLMLLAERVGDDLLRARQEIEKLSQYAEKGVALAGADAQAVIAKGQPDAGPYGVFDFVDAVMDGNPAVAAEKLETLLAAGQSPLGLVAMIALQLRLVLGALAFEGEPVHALAHAVGAREFPARKAIAQSRNWSLERVVAALELCAETDSSIKRGADGRMALQLLSFKLSTMRSDR